MTWLSRVLLMVVVQAAPSLNPEWGAVLPADQALTFARPRLCNRPAPGPADGTWRPDADTIRRLESVLAAELQAAIDLSSEPHRKQLATEYYRQYAPLVISGRRILYVNGWHRSAAERSVDGNPDSSWKTSAVYACDGGTLFFGAEYDVATSRLSRIIFNGGGRGGGLGSADRAGSLPPAVATLVTKAALDGRVYSWCEVASGFAIATIGPGARRYVVVYGDGRVETLGTYNGDPDLSCYSRREAEKLNASIKESETIHGGVTPRWDTTVICGFIADTEAVCWQFSPVERAFVKIGGWIT